MISPSAILHGKVLIVDDQKANILLLEQMLGETSGSDHELRSQCAIG